MTAPEMIPIFLGTGLVFGGLVVWFVIRAIRKDNRLESAAKPVAGQEERKGADSATGLVSPEGPPLTGQVATTTEGALAPAKSELRSVESALSGTRRNFFDRIKGLFGARPHLDPSAHEELEEILYTSDLGPKTVRQLMDRLDERLTEIPSADFEVVRQTIRGEMLEILDGPHSKAVPLWNGKAKESLQVWMIVGVNGAGKTTTIGKLAHTLAGGGTKVLIAAGDTFRAAAAAQLKVWSERAQVEIFSPEGVTSPSAVAFDACKKASSGNFGALIVDTAGRLHTQKNLMDELTKMKKVVEKAVPGAPHEVLLVLDANAGQNALIQAKEFHQALGVTGVILTKLDGTAKGGVALGVACELGLPIRCIGVGEGMDDLRAFSPKEFVESII